MADDDDHLDPLDAAIEKIYDAQFMLNEARRELDPRESPSDAEYAEVLLELCRTNPELAAESILASRTQMFVVMPTELTRLLGLDAAQKAKLRQWVREKLDVFAGSVAPDIFSLTKGNDTSDGGDANP